jgi:hypothetical protein
MINSIYLSTLIQNDNRLEKVESKPNLALPIKQNQDGSHINYVEIEKFVMLYDNKIYFYDALFEYMDNFIKKKKIRFDLNREKPQMLGFLIESILKDWIRSKKGYEKLKSQFNKLIYK